MNIQNLVNYCVENGISLNTQIAVRAKDDYFITADDLSLDIPYFGNCGKGDGWLRENVNLDEDGCVNYDDVPYFLILDSGR